MRVVITDFDGVLNYRRYKETAEEREKLAKIYETRLGREDRMTDNAVGLAIENVAILNEIVEKANANVLISSSWAWSFSLPQMASMLHARGFKDPGKIIGAVVLDSLILPGGKIYWDDYDNENRNDSLRSRAIKYWIERVKPEAFVILEDNLPMGSLQEFTIMIDGRVGLQSEHVKRALEILNV